MVENHICKKCGSIAGWDSYFQAWVCTRCGNEEPKPITRADRFRSMTDDELAKYIDEHTADAMWCNSPPFDCPPDKECVNCILNWLKEATENAGDEPDTAAC